MPGKKTFLIVDDLKDFSDDIRRATSSEVSRYNYVHITNFKRAVDFIQDSSNDIEIAILDLSFAFDETVGYESYYGWILIPLLRMHQPAASIAIHSNTAMHVENMYRALYIYNVENVCHSAINPIKTPIGDLVRRMGIEIPSTNWANLQSHLDSQKPKSLKDNPEGLELEQALILEFARQRHSMPEFAYDGTFLRRKNGRYFSKGDVASILRSIKTKVKDMGLLNEHLPPSPEILTRLLESKNELLQHNRLELEGLIEPLILLAQGGKIGEVASETGVMSRQSLRKNINKLYENAFTTTNDETKLSNTEKAIALCERFKIKF